MNLATRKYNLIQELTTIDESLLEKLELILKTSKKDWFTPETVMNRFAKWH